MPNRNRNPIRLRNGQYATPLQRFAEDIWVGVAWIVFAIVAILVLIAVLTAG